MYTYIMHGLIFQLFDKLDTLIRTNCVNLRGTQHSDVSMDTVPARTTRNEGFTYCAPFRELIETARHSPTNSLSRLQTHHR